MLPSLLTQGLTVASDERRFNLGGLLYVPPDEDNKKNSGKVFQYVRCMTAIASLGAGLFWYYDATDAQIEVDDAIPTGVEQSCMGVACATATAGQYLWAQVFGFNEVAMTNSGNTTANDALFPSGTGTWNTCSTADTISDGGAGRFVSTLTATAGAGAL